MGTCSAVAHPGTKHPPTSTPRPPWGKREELFSEAGCQAHPCHQRGHYARAPKEAHRCLGVPGMSWSHRGLSEVLQTTGSSRLLVLSPKSALSMERGLPRPRSSWTRVGAEATTRSSLCVDSLKDPEWAWCPSQAGPGSWEELPASAGQLLRAGRVAGGHSL